MGEVTATVHLPSGQYFRAVVDASNADPVATQLGRGSLPHAPHWPLFAGLVPPGGLVLDLGAHQGAFALAAAALGYRVIAVEASAANAELLRRSARLNRFHKLEVINVALTDRAGTVRFVPDGPYGHVDIDDGAGSLAVETPATTVDALLTDLGISNVDFVKMDIEGSEPAAVRGMSKLLRRNDAPVVFYESNGYTLDLFGSSDRALKSQLAAFGYTNYLVDQARSRLVPVRPTDLQPECVVDYLAVKHGRSRPIWGVLGRAGSNRRTIGGWLVDRPLSRARTLEWFRDVCASEVGEHHRAHLLRVCGAAPSWIRKDPIISTFLRAHHHAAKPQSRT